MAEKKPTPTATIVLACALCGGLAAVEVGQSFWPAIEGSQNKTLGVIAVGALVAGIVGWILAKRKAAPKPEAE